MQFSTDDLERIIKGEKITLNTNFKGDGELVSLANFDREIMKLKKLRTFILDEFKKDACSKLAKPNGIIGYKPEVLVNPTKIFAGDYLSLIIPSDIGNTKVLVSENGIVNASFRTSELEKQIKKIMPYIIGLINVHNNSNILQNDFYYPTYLFDDLGQLSLLLSGLGVTLPCDNYFISHEELQQILVKFYSNYYKIIENIFVNDSFLFDQYKKNLSKDKVLDLYQKRH